MSPKDFIAARNEWEKSVLLAARENPHNGGSDESSNDPSLHLSQRRYWIDGQVYLPSVSATDGDEDSIRTVVGAMWELTPSVVANLLVEPISGGITNKLYRVSGILVPPATPMFGEPPPPPRQVLLRIFGAEGLIDRDVETSTYAALAQQGIALKYYGRFGNGRLEEWCDGNANGYANGNNSSDGAKHLEVRDLSNGRFLRGIAQAVGRLHSQFVIPAELQEYHNLAAPPTLWTQLESWLEQALKNESEDDTTLDLSRLQDEIPWLKQNVCRRANAKMGFCHNDLLAANILQFPLLNNNDHDDDDNTDNDATAVIGIQLIDFEYGGVNYLAYDIANHFNEFAGGTTTSTTTTPTTTTTTISTPENDHPAATPDYSLFPSKDFQRLFCHEYLKACHTSSSGGGCDDGQNNDEYIVGDDEVSLLLEEIQGFVLANHLVWGLWAVNQAAAEGCDHFDYLHYGSCRIQRYFLEKKEWEAQAQSKN